MNRYKVSEANLPTAMKFVFDYFISPLDNKHLLGYRPTHDDRQRWERDNPTTGVIYLKKFPQLKAAWVLVKFEQTQDKVYGQHQVAQDKVTIRNVQEFQNFFGVTPSASFNWTPDMTMYVRWNKQNVVNPYPYRDFDETTPNFYMYVNHLKVNLDKVIQRLYRMNEILEKDPNAIKGDMFNLPYNLTNI